jgi:hypothetical protein
MVPRGVYIRSKRGPRIQGLEPPNPSGLCQCGCGELTSIAKRTDRSRSDVYGQHKRFRPNHHLRVANPARRSTPANPMRPWLNRAQNRWYFYDRKGRGSAWARAVLECKLGRELTADEDAHHINGDTTDDRPENLEALSKSEHTRLHHLVRPQD